MKQPLGASLGQYSTLTRTCLRNMKNATLLSLSLLLLCILQTSVIFAQRSTRFGVDLKLTSATQLMRFPQIPNEGTFQANRLGTLGAGIFAEKSLNKARTFWAIVKANYIRKGFKLPNQYGEINSDIYFEFDQNHTFDFLDFDLLARYKFRQRFLPSISAGLRTGFLLAKHIGSDFIPFNLSSYPKEFYDYNRISAGWVLGLSYPLTHEFSIGLETNLELLPTINREDFTARNWITSVNISYYWWK